MLMMLMEVAGPRQSIHISFVMAIHDYVDPTDLQV